MGNNRYTPSLIAAGGHADFDKLTQPDTVAMHQYLQSCVRSILAPEKLLLLAILEDAIACFQKYVLARDAKGKSLFQDAENWFMQEDYDWQFSFCSVCESLGFDPGYLRRGLIRWKEKQLSTVFKPEMKDRHYNHKGFKRSTG